MLFHDFSQLQDFLFGVEVTCRVVRVADHDGLCLRGDDLLELLDGRKGEAVLNSGHDGLHSHAAGDGETVVVGVERFGDDDFVARVEAAVESEQDGLRTARGHDDFIGGEVDVDAFVVLDQLFAAAEDTGGVAVGNHLLVKLLDSLAGAFGCLDVGLPDVEVIDVDTSFLGFVRKWDELTDGRGGHRLPFVGNLWHNLLLFNCLDQKSNVSKNAANIVKKTNITTDVFCSARTLLCQCLPFPHATLWAPILRWYHPAPRVPAGNRTRGAGSN